MTGTRAMSGSLAIRFRKRTIAAWLSSMASSMLTSTIWAPFSTCWRATASACSYWPLRIMRAKAFDPVTLVRSPMLTNRLPSPITSGSRPDSSMGGTAGAAALTTWLMDDSGKATGNQTLNRKFMTSPSLTMYSLPSARILPASLAPASPL